MDFCEWKYKPKNLQAPFCKLYPADFVGCDLLVFVFLAFRICCVSFSSKFLPDDPRGSKKPMGRARCGSAKRVDFDATTHQSKKSLGVSTESNRGQADNPCFCQVLRSYALS